MMSRSKQKSSQLVASQSGGVNMRINQSECCRGRAAALIALMCIGYAACARGPEKSNGVTTPPPTASPAPTAASPQPGEVPANGTPVAVSDSGTSAQPPATSAAAPAAGSAASGAPLGAGSAAAAGSSGSAAAGGSAAPGSPVAAELPPPPPPRIFTLSSSTPLSIYTTTELSTKTSRAGDAFTGTLARPIVDKDWVVAKDGAPVEGVVLSSDPGGRVKGVASITVALRRLTLADGRKLDISTSAFTQKAKTTKGKDATKIIGGAGVGALIGALAGGRKGAAIGAGAGGAAGTGLVLATRGDPATIAREARLTFRLKAPVRIMKPQRIP